MTETQPERRKAAPGATYHRNVGSVLVTLRAGKDGVVSIRTDAERQVADAFGLPVARVTKPKGDD